MIAYVIAIVAIAFVFDFINGFHDSANSIATIVGTRVLNPFTAVLWAATFNFAALFTVGTAVASTIGKGMINVAIVDANVILGGLLGILMMIPLRRALIVKEHGNLLYPEGTACADVLMKKNCAWPEDPLANNTSFSPCPM